jgi:cytochrome c-type biogenesis protein CcmE
MKPKRRRLYFVVAGMALLGIAAVLVLYAMNDTLVFFYSPSELLAKQVPPGRTLRIGGLVETGSVARDADGTTVHFRVTDTAKTVAVVYTGILPDLFREGQGVVAEGTMSQDGVFVAAEVLAKHDENYMPKEVVDALVGRRAPRRNSRRSGGKNMNRRDAEAQRSTHLRRRRRKSLSVFICVHLWLHSFLILCASVSLRFT